MSDKCERCQIRWERDQAMEQLEEHHIPFGCVADDVVKVVRCKDCKFFRAFAEPYMDFEPDGYCNIYESTEGFEHFCSYGERRSE